MMRTESVKAGGPFLQGHPLREVGACRNARQFEPPATAHPAPSTERQKMKVLVHLPDGKIQGTRKSYPGEIGQEQVTRAAADGPSSNDKDNDRGPERAKINKRERDVVASEHEV